MLKILDYIYISLSAFSIIASLSSFIFVYRLAVRSSGGGGGGGGGRQRLSLIQKAQLGMYFAIVLYHSVSLAGFLVDIFYAELGQISYWNGENIKGWFALVSQAGTDMALINGALWTVILNLKLAPVTENNLFAKIKSLNSKTAFLAKTTVALNIAVFISRLVIAIVCRADGGRVSMWSSLQVDVFFIIDFFIFVPVTISMISVYLELKRQSIKNAAAQASLLRMIFFGCFVSFLCPMAVVFLTLNGILRYPGRLTRDYTPQDVDDYYAEQSKAKNEIYLGKYQSSHATIPLLLYSICGLLLSMPFVQRKDFIQVIWTGKSNLENTTSNPTSSSTCQPSGRLSAAAAPSNASFTMDRRS